MGDPGGVIAALIEEALRLGIDPAKYAGIVLQQGVAEGTRATQAARPAPPAPPQLTDDEKALLYAHDHVARFDGVVHDLINGVPGPNDVWVQPGGLVVCGGTVYRNDSGANLTLHMQSAASLKSACDSGVGLGYLTIIYP